MSWELGMLAVLALALALGFAWYERSRPPARVIALVAALAALGVVGRLAFAPFPNVKPTTDIVLFAGYALGGAPGFAVGSVTALVSNVFLSQGPWTPWQMAAWGGVGLAGGALGRLAGGRELGRWALALACGAAGVAYGAAMDLYLWTLAGEHSLGAYVVISARSLPFNAAHAAGNVVFALVIGPPLVRALQRYRRRFEVRWAVRPALPAVLVAVAACSLLALASPRPARADAASSRAARYLLGSQGADGGFSAVRGGQTGEPYTGEVALGLAAAGRNPRDVRSHGRSIVDYLRRHAGPIREAGDLERTILVLRAAGLSPRRFAGRDLYRDLVRARGDGSFDGSTNHIAFGVLALRAAGEGPSSGRVQGSLDRLLDRQHADGGFGLGSESDADNTGAALEALAAAGEGGGEPARAAVGYLADSQDPSGGFPGYRRGANAQSTAWAVQGLVAAGRGGSTAGRRGLAYLRSLQRSDGSIRYSRTSAQTPVWVTGQALAALERKPFPLDPVPCRTCGRRPARGDRAPVGAGGEGLPKPGPSRGADTPSRPRAAGGAGEAGPGSGAGPGPGSGGSGGADGSEGAGPTGASPGGGPGDPGGPSGPGGGPPGASGALGSPPSLGAPGGIAAGAGTAAGLSASAGQSPAAWRAFSDAGPLAAARTAAHGRRAPGPARGAVPAFVALGAVAVALVAAIAGAARLRRLWAAVRRRTARREASS